MSHRESPGRFSATHDVIENREQRSPDGRSAAFMPAAVSRSFGEYSKKMIMHPLRTGRIPERGQKQAL